MGNYTSTEDLKILTGIIITYTGKSHVHHAELKCSSNIRETKKSTEIKINWIKIEIKTNQNQMLVFHERGKPEFLGKTSRSRVSITNKLNPHLWPESNLDQVGGRWIMMYYPLQQPCSKKIISVYNINL